MKDRVMSFRINRDAAKWFDEFQADTNLDNTSIAAREVFVMGLQTHRLVVGKDTRVPSTLAMETMIDRMSTEQKERLLDLLIQKLGIKEVSRLRMLAMGK